MANDKRFKVKNGLETQNISFIDTSDNEITVSITDDRISFSGDSGQLFSITDSLTGTIFAVNDISGVPSIEVDDDGTVRFAEISGNVLIGTTTDDGTNRLQVAGGVSATDLSVTNTITGSIDTADKWTTARTLSLTGAVTGSASIDGSGNVSLATTATSDPTLTLNGDVSGSATFTDLGDATLTVTVADDSHNHIISNVDGLQTALDAKYQSGDSISVANITATGYLRGPATFTIDPSAHGDNTGTVVIAGNLQVDGTTTTINSTTVEVDDLNITLASGAANAAAADGAGITIDGASATLTYNGTSDYFAFNKEVYVGTNQVFHDGYHPNADKWTTARTLTLSGDVSGSASIDGSGNVSMTTTVADDSHNHIISNVDGLQTALDAKVDLAGDTMTGALNMFERNKITGLSGSVANYPALTFESSEGTHAAKTQTLSGDLIGRIEFNPYTGSSYTSGGRIDFLATESIISAQRGTEARIYGTKTGESAQSYLQFKDDEVKIKDVAGSFHKVFADNYHPNADKWTTARTNTVTLTGEVTGTGSASVDGTGNWTVTVNTSAANTYDNYVSWTAMDHDGTSYTVTSGDTLQFKEGSAIDVNFTNDDELTISHADTSSQGSVDNSNGTVIQDVTLDGFGHITALGSVNLDDRYYTETEADNRFVNVDGDTMTGTLEQSYGGVVWSHNEATTRPVSRLTYSEAGSIGTTGTNITDVYGEADLSAIDNGATFTYEAAWDAVESHGGRLPTLAEVMDGVGQGSGQGYDSEYIWTCTPAGPHHVWVVKGLYGSTADRQIVDITNAANVYRCRAFFDVSRDGRFVSYNHDESVTLGGNLGVGTSTPSYKTDIQGTSTTLLNIEGAATTGNAETKLRLAQPANTVGALNEIRSGVTSGTNPYLAFAVRETNSPFGVEERLRIDGLGNVGIGVSSIDADFKTEIDGRLRIRADGFSTSGVTADFVVVGNTQSTDETVYPSIFVSNRATTTESLARIHLVGGDGTVSGNLFVDGVGTASGLGTRALALQTLSNHPLVFRVNATEAMRIDNSGNVGIGTAAPAELLHVFDNVNNSTSLTTTGTGTKGATIKIENDNTTVNSYAALELRANTADAKIAVITRSTSTNDADLAFIVDDQSTGLGVERVRIVGETGNVGIGTGSPQKTLDVRGTFAISNSTVNYWEFDRDDVDGSLTIADSGTERMRVTAAGNVGIGTTSPASVLEVNTGTGASTANTVIIDRAASSSYSGVTFSTNGTEDWSIGQNSTGGFQIYENGLASSTRLTIKDGGNVGIGTTAPDSKLHVLGTTTLESDLDFVSPDGTNTISVNMLDTDTLSFEGESGQLFSITDSLSGTIFSVNDISGIPSIEVDDDGTIRLAEFSGNVGIGTASPSAKLEIDAGSEGQAAAVEAIRIAGPNTPFNENGAQDIKWQFDFAGSSIIRSFRGTSWDTFLTFHTTQYSAGSNSPQERMRITDSGNVGIGTSSPASVLHVSSTGANAHSTTITKGTNHKGITVTQQNNADDMTGIYFATGTDAEGTHWSGITGSRSDNASHWGTQLNFYTHDENTSNLTDATQKMVIKGSGNVGIGTTTPQAKLDVEGGDNQYEIVRIGSSSSDNSELTLGYWDATATNGLPALVGSSDFGGLIQGGENGNLILGIRDNDITDGLAIVSGGGNFMTDSTYDTLIAKFAANGRIGIGKNTPSYVLDVNGEGRFTRSSSSFILNIDSTAGEGRVIRFRDDGSTKYNWIAGSQYNVDNAFEITPSTAAGGNVFSAPALVITSGGNVGIGTSSPSSILHIAPEATDPTNNDHRLEYVVKADSGHASGYAASGLSIIGQSLNTSGDLHTTYVQLATRAPSLNGSHGAVSFMALTSPGSQSTYGTGQIDFYIRNDAAYTFPNDPSVPSNYWMPSLMTIKSNGNVGIGTTSPTEKLHVAGNILATGNITAYSDIRIKDDIQQIESALEKVSAIRGVTFKRKESDENRRYTGVIAQEVEAVLPEVISNNNDGMKSVAYGNMVGLLIEAIKELKAEVDSLKAELAEK